MAAVLSARAWCGALRGRRRGDAEGAALKMQPHPKDKPKRRKSCDDEQTTQPMKARGWTKCKHGENE